jgi:hypothetical protein
MPVSEFVFVPAALEAALVELEFQVGEAPAAGAF